jgi:hypothetical protein
LAVGGAGSCVGAVVSSSSFDDELVWAPSVLTTTPVGACRFVDAVDVEVASEPVVGSVAVVAVSLAASVESEAFVDDFDDSDDSDDFDDSDEDEDEDEDDDSEVDESGVSAHATPCPYPVTTAAPTPRATAKPPTRPT